MSSARLLEAQQIRRLADDQTVLLNSVSVSFDAGSTTAITGPPGSGKTLLLRTLNLLDPIAGGEIRFRGTPIEDADVPAFRRRVMLVPQRSVLIEGTVRENLQLPFQFRSPKDSHYDEEHVAELLTRLDRDVSFLDRLTDDLSGGESQIVALLRAVQLNPIVLLLDEPTSSLDATLTDAAERLIGDWQTGDVERTLIVVSHQPRQVSRLARRVVSIERGAIISDEENTDTESTIGSA